MFTSTNPSPQPSPRLDGERVLFPFGACVKGVLPKSFWRRRSAAVSAAARSTHQKPWNFVRSFGNPSCCGWDTRAPFHLSNTPLGGGGLSRVQCSELRMA
jgi:hypothetical protein